jgi:hypothetical protein
MIRLIQKYLQISYFFGMQSGCLYVRKPSAFFYERGKVHIYKVNNFLLEDD